MFVNIQEQIADAVEFALIEQLGGYEKAKEQVSRLELNGNLVTAEALKLDLLQYRRAHGIYEVGDDIACLNSRRYKIYKFPSNKDHWLNFEEIRHATDAEIEAGCRL